MSPLPVTLLTASILALLFVFLSLRVVQSRLSTKISMGLGEQSSVKIGSDTSAPKLMVTARTHGNFAEYVPISLLLLGFIEISRGNHKLVIALGGILILSRLLHAIGMTMKAPNLFRVGGVALQWTMLMVAGVYGIMLILPNI
jgi:uncharacterized protein